MQRQSDEHYNTYIVDYDFAGAKYSFEIKAESWRVAENAVAAIRQSAVVVGENPVSFAPGTPKWVVMLKLWWRGINAKTDR